MLRVGLRFIEL